MTRPTDEELGSLLTQTFRAHEHLADPERAVAVAASSDRQPRHRRVLLGSAAAVAVVVGGTALLVGQHDGATPPVLGRIQTPGAEHQPALPPLHSDAGNRAAAARAAEHAAASLPVFPGARETDAAGGPPLNRWSVAISGPASYTVTRQRWWIATGATAYAVARWYDEHPPAGFRSEGVGGEGDGRTWVSTVDFDPPNGRQLPPSGVTVEVQTLDAVGGVEVRAVVKSVWPPARPAASYVQDVSSVAVEIAETHLGPRRHSSRRSFSVTAPGRVLRIARVFDSLPGYPPFPHSCPAITSFTSYRIVFHTATGDVTARYTASACATGMSVQRSGQQVPPDLAGADRLIRLLRRGG